MNKEYKKFEDIKILVIGDIMLDRYIVGDVERISPEAPVPILHKQKEYYVLGGCGNVINNLLATGVKVSCISRIGYDTPGDRIQNDLLEKGVDTKLIKNEDIPTIEKTRFVAGERETQLLRVDTEKISENKTEISDIINKIHQKYDYDIIVISDYGKGMITKPLMNYIKGLGIKVIVDPKPINEDLYQDVFMITPNEKEFKQINLPNKNINYVLCTMGKHGMILIDNTKDKSTSIKTDAVDVYNVSGAGDTVIAVMASCISSGMTLIDSAKIANKCAGFVVTKPGTTVIPNTLFNKYINEIIYY